MLVGLMTITALGVLQTLEHDAQLHQLEDRILSARATAEGGLREVLNDARILTLLPSSAGDSAKLVFSQPSVSEFFGSGSQAPKYTAKVTLVRSAPALESSQRRVRMVLYESKVRSEVVGGNTSEIEAVIYRLGIVPNNQSGAEVFGR
ncbi:MAG: hypothetical protein KTR25_15715 [Myxococcales bacterium]|nr:hypothetical protein [Myxococcales bacterium]